MEEELSLDCWAEKRKQGQADEMPRMVQERARGLEKGDGAGTKGKYNSFIMMPGPFLTQLHLGAGEETGASGSREAL